jgi:flagellar basal-body rod modification protein FlgD
MTSPINNNTNAPATNNRSSSDGTTPAAMSQSDFLKLMVAQLQAQDPTNPVDNSQFVSQMTQFSTLSATQDLGTSVTNLSTNIAASQQTSEILSSAGLVGHSVLVPETTADYEGSEIDGAVNVQASGNVNVTVTDQNGNVVRTIPMGTQDPGLQNFSWDGKDSSGNPVANGKYTLAATSGGTAVDTYVAGKITGAGYGGSSVGTYLQVAGIGGVPLSQVAQIL